MAKCDMFLKMVGTVTGPIKGEANDQAHADEIEVAGWEWGMEGSTVTMGTASKVTVHQIKLTKRFDRASTAIMSCVRNNELIKSAVLTVRKAGGTEPVEYCTITLEKARITSVIVRSSDDGGTPQLDEHISLSCTKLTVDYRGQAEDGSSLGASTFETEIFASH